MAAEPEPAYDWMQLEITAGPDGADLDLIAHLDLRGNGIGPVVRGVGVSRVEHGIVWVDDQGGGSTRFTRRGDEEVPRDDA